MNAMEKPVLSSLLRINRYHRKALRCALAPYQYVGVMHLIDRKSTRLNSSHWS